MSFNPGDVVVLPGHGRLMTVEESETSSSCGFVACVWFDGNEVHRADFYGECLRLATDADRGAK